MKLELREISKVIGNYLSRSGYNISYIDYSTKIQEFLSWYKGTTTWHEYKVWNGTNNIGKTRASLDMAKTACEDMASLLMNEKVKINMADELSQKMIDDCLEDNNYYVMQNNLIEIMCGLGTGANVESIYTDSKGLIQKKIDYIHGDMIFPLTWDNGKIIECAFGTIGKEDNKVFYTLIIHRLGDDGKYIIETVNIDSEGSVVIPSSLAQGQEENSSIFETGSEIPLFQIIKPNIVNNYDKTCPLGMSIFGNAIEILKSIDTKYDSWRNEFETGKRKIFIKSNLMNVQYKVDSADVVPVVDPSDTIFYQIEWSKDDVPIHEFSPDLRDAEHANSLDVELKLFSRKVGLGDSFYAFNNGAVARTATEVVSTNSALFRNLKKHELVLKSAIIGMCRALLNLENIFNGGNYDVWQEITVDFDDSIVEDTDKEQQKAMAEYNAGLIDRVEYFVLTRNMTREQAQKLVAEMDATDTMKETLNFMNSSQFGGF